MATAAVMAVAAVGSAVVANNASKRAAAAQRRGQDLAQQNIRQGTQQALADVNRLFPQAMNTANLGFQGALDVFNRSIPLQSSAFQQGNIGAQEQLIAALPQIQNAILGGQVDFSQLQPVRIDPYNYNAPVQQLGPTKLPTMTAPLTQVPTAIEPPMRLLGGMGEGGRKFEPTKRV